MVANPFTPPERLDSPLKGNWKVATHRRSSPPAIGGTLLRRVVHEQNLWKGLISERAGKRSREIRKNLRTTCPRVFIVEVSGLLKEAWEK